MAQYYILSIDQGTTGTTASIIDQNGKAISKVNEEYKQLYPKPGWVEHNPDDIWNSVVQTVNSVIKKSQISANSIVGIGITNQRETSVVWNKSDHKPLYNAIVWQCRRTTDFCHTLKKKKLGNTIKSKTGLVVDPYFSSSKVKWILDHVSGARKLAKSGQLAFGTIDSFLLWKLTNGSSHQSDVSNASRTQLMNIKKGDWDKDLLKIFNVPQEILPQIKPSSGVFGKTKGFPGLPDGIPISGIAGDQQAALFGQTCFKEGQSKCTYGTGSFILMNTGNKVVQSKSGILSTIAWKLSEKSPIVYALEGGAFICGAAVQWLRDEMGFVAKSSEIENLALQVEDTGGVEFVPALTGLGAPYWKPEARGVITGLTRGTTKAHLARATLEALALQNVDILKAMEKDLGKKMKDLRVDGGASENNLLMQLQADYLGTAIQRPELIETTSMGAAYLAGLGVGLWKDTQEIQKIWKREKEFSPQINLKQRKVRLDSWHNSIKKAF